MTWYRSGLPVGHKDRDVEFRFQVGCQVLGAVDGTMLAAGAAKAHLEVGEPAFQEALHVGIDQLVYALQEGGDFAVFFQELDDVCVHAGGFAVALVFAGIVDGAAVKDVAAAVAGKVFRNAFLEGETVNMHQQFAGFFRHCFPEAGKGHDLLQQAVQVGIVREGRLEEAAEVVHGRGNAGDERGFALKQAPEAVCAQHLQGAEQHKQAQAAVEMGLVHFLELTQRFEVGFQQLFLGGFREAGTGLPDKGRYIVIDGAPPATLKVDDPGLSIFNHDVSGLEVPVHEGVALFYKKICFKPFKIVLQAFFVELQTGGFQETVLEVVEVKVHHARVEGLIHALLPVQAFCACKLQAGEFLQGLAEQPGFFFAVRTFFPSRGHGLEQAACAKVFLQVGHLVLAHGHYLRNGQPFFPEMAGKVKESPVLFRVVAHNPHQGAGGALKAEITAVAAGGRKCLNVLRLLSCTGLK